MLANEENIYGSFIISNKIIVHCFVLIFHHIKAILLFIRKKCIFHVINNNNITIELLYILHITIMNYNSNIIFAVII